MLCGERAFQSLRKFFRWYFGCRRFRKKHSQTEKAIMRDSGLMTQRQFALDRSDQLMGHRIIKTRPMSMPPWGVGQRPCNAGLFERNRKGLPPQMYQQTSRLRKGTLYRISLTFTCKLAAECHQHGTNFGQF